MGIYFGLRLCVHMLDFFVSNLDFVSLRWDPMYTRHVLSSHVGSPTLCVIVSLYVSISMIHIQCHFHILVYLFVSYPSIYCLSCITIISEVYMSDFLCLHVFLSYVSHYNGSKVSSQTAVGV